MATISVEERLAAVELELAQIKQRLETEKPQTAVPWWEQISGVFKDSPEFEEAVRLGREWREAQRKGYEDDAILLTPNLADFGKVPGLKAEDWSA